MTEGVFDEKEERWARQGKTHRKLRAFKRNLVFLVGSTSPFSVHPTKNSETFLKPF